MTPAPAPPPREQPAPPPEQPAQTSNWTGPHAGGGGGANNLFTSANTLAVDPPPDDISFVYAKADSDAGVASGFGTVEAGYDLQLGSVVVGILGNFDFQDSSIRLRAEGGDEFDFITSRTELNMGNSWAVGGRIGYVAFGCGCTLFYGLGGFTQAEFGIDHSGRIFDAESPTPNPFLEVNGSKGKDWTDGWFVGAGAETLVTENLSLKLEYRFARYDSLHLEDAFELDGFTIRQESSYDDPEVHTIRGVLSWRFGNLFGPY
jgi:outer membrane immunogenic protein